VGVVAGGIAWADIPDAGVIHGCYKTVGGVLRVVDADKGGKCTSGETALNWSQPGPTGTKGPSGPTGPTGPKGPTGQAGPSDAYTNYGQWGVIASGDTVTEASVTLPAGSYTLTGAVGFYGNDSALVECKYVSAGTVNGL